MHPHTPGTEGLGVPTPTPGATDGSDPDGPADGAGLATTRAPRHQGNRRTGRPPAATPGGLEVDRRTVLKAGAIGAAAAALPLAACTVDPEPVPPAPGPMEVTLRVNGQDHALAVEPRVTLLDALRERIGLTGTKKGCDRGECGACTVLVEDRRIKSCMTLAVMQDARNITTVEGLASGEELHPVQAAFIRQDGLQCGFCTPGQIMSAVAVIREGHTSSDAEIRDWMSGNLCRCSCYPNIVAAVREAAEEVR